MSAPSTIDELLDTIEKVYHTPLVSKVRVEVEKLRAQIEKSLPIYQAVAKEREVAIAAADALRADLAAARALLRDVHGWLDPWESRQSALRDRIDAALAGEGKP